MRSVIIFFIQFVISLSVYSQDIFIYGQKGEKIYFRTVDSIVQLKFIDGLNDNEKLTIIKSVNPYYNFKEITIKNRTCIPINKDYLPNFDKLENNNSLVYVNKSLVYKDGTIHIPTDKLLVKIIDNYKFDEILFKLNVEYKDYRHIGYDNNSYLLTINNGKSIQTANLLYESGYFEYAQPSFTRIINTMNEYYDDQWGLNNTGQNGGTYGIDINATDAWDVTFGIDDIAIAIIDQGVDLDHPDLEDNLRAGYDATDGGSGGNTNGDCFGDDAHGTACAGIAAAIDNEIGIIGVAPNCQVIPIRVSYTYNDYQIWDDDWIVDAINHAWEIAETDIISCSWGGGYPNQAITNEIDDALDLGRNELGCVIVFAVGNYNFDSVVYPANSNPDIIAVGAMSPCGERKSPNSCDEEDWYRPYPYDDYLGGSNYGDELDVMAPGVFIPTTDIQGSAGYNESDGTAGNYYLLFNGTSSATPHVAGIAALILSVNPNLTQDQVRDIIESTAQKVGDYSYSTTGGRPNGTWYEEMGYGLVDAYQSVIEAAGGPISGSSVICSSGTTFNISPPASFDSLRWNTGPYLNISSGQGTYYCTVYSTGQGSSYVGVTVYANGNGTTLPLKSVWAGMPSIINPATIQFTCIEGSGYFCTNAFGNEFSFYYPSPEYSWNSFDIKLTNLSETQTLTQFTIYDTWGTLDLEFCPPDGTYLFQVRANNDCGSTNWSKEQVEYVDCGYGGLFSLNIYPNPTKEEATVSIISAKDKTKIIDLDKAWQLEVYTQGQLLKYSIPVIIDNKYVLNTSGWKAGMYFIRVFYKDEVLWGRLIVNE